MRTKHFLLSIAIISLMGVFVSCSDKDELSAEMTVPIEETTNPFYVSYDEALEMAVNHLNASKSYDRVFSKDEVLDHTEFLTKDNRRLLTRSAGTAADTVDVRFHVINFEDGGFALVSADSRTTPIYAFSETGSLNIDDAMENTGFSDFMEASIQYYSKEIVYDGGKDSIKMCLPYGTYNGKTYYAEYIRTDTICKSRIMHTEWGQSDPYNYYCPKINGTACLTGCVPVAVGQIMAYYQYPKTIVDKSNKNITYTLPWSDMLSQGSYLAGNTGTGALGVARLLRQLGLYMGASYGIDETGVLEEGFNNIFEKFGYTTSGLKSFKADSIVSSLDKDQPVFICGSTSQGGHAWVLEGYKEYRELAHLYTTQYPNFDMGIHYLDCEDRYYFCNWGWNGYYNGYYLDTFYLACSQTLTSKKIIYNITL